MTLEERRNLVARDGRQERVRKHLVDLGHAAFPQAPRRTRKYAEVGYRRIGDWEELAFEPPSD